MNPGAGLPILRLGDILISGLLSDLDDTTALRFTDELTTRISDEGIRGVILDISRLEIIDSFVARVLMELAATGRVLGARMIVAGMRPAVAITLSGLGLRLTGVQTALNAEQAMELLGWRPPTEAAEEAPHAS
ncbi:STAS domain-containing protein [Amycolatopsis regifaucium]|uniref:Anti-anti-sigma factor n=1 Tax=Amycolatopsis regifaucium TaxID=546365 RepID=A0A154MNH0_9PSEU|nr:STAS domain-containing protein [Amycolatopsis regifaucium]KZB85387.1 anti-anti-sigma factor [Amycolatopsis regifaucium]OKA09005.1 anti-anti-sigma factor [Amycolatopsis regifaucium]SFJ38709.1 rsbT antagonist protein RsbS [Amycolatopsis regifaucium]